MTLNPEDRRNWQGFLDLLQPPEGYRLVSAVGTTFGVSFDVLTAALLAMCEADGEELSANPVAAVTAITRLRDRVRVLVHPATIVPPAPSLGAGSFVALLDRIVLQARPSVGLFHPKVWALRFEHIGTPRAGTPRERGRLLVGSRNLTRSTSFELAAVFDGVPAQRRDGTLLANDVGRALKQWLQLVSESVPRPVEELLDFIPALVLESTPETAQAARMHWQGMGRSPLAGKVDGSIDRALVVSPFLQPEFVNFMLERSRVLQFVSIPETLDGLPDHTFASLEARAREQKMPTLFQVTGHGDPDDFQLEGVHAKMLLLEGAGSAAVTFVGSANGTGPGWGIAAPANVEAMVEMRPGISQAGFINGFIQRGKADLHPWISKYDRAARPEPDVVEELQKQLLAALRDLARVDFSVSYDAARETLILAGGGTRTLVPAVLRDRGVTVSCVPLLLSSRPDAWQPLSELDARACEYSDVPLKQVSAFVVLRAVSREPAVECQRMVLAKLQLDQSVIDRRDELLRRDVVDSTDPATVLAALIKGLAFVRVDAARGEGGAPARAGYRALLQETTLERLLQAVALDPSLVRDMKLLLGHHKELLELGELLESVVDREEVAS